jgi:hypothetical protein
MQACQVLQAAVAAASQLLAAAAVLHLTLCRQQLVQQAIAVPVDHPAPAVAVLRVPAGQQTRPALVKKQLIAISPLQVPLLPLAAAVPGLLHTLALIAAAAAAAAVSSRGYWRS